MSHDSDSPPACARCGATHSMVVEGLCSPCLLRLALASERPDEVTAPDGKNRVQPNAGTTNAKIVPVR
jgi:hypothetical protein